MRDFSDNSVGVIECRETNYPPGPFHPPVEYPEYPFKGSGIQPENQVYEAVRELFQRLGMDKEHFGSPEWNPLGDIIKMGDKVVLKPNLVISEHELGQAGIESATVHGSIIRPFVDYAFIALKGEGRITIGDSPIKEVDFEKIMGLIGVTDMLNFFSTTFPLVPLEIVDYRDVRAWRKPDGTIVASKKLSGDERGYTVIDLGDDSLFAEISDHCERFRSTATIYENVMREVHNKSTNKYSFANTVLDADVVISLSKMKTHRKSGVTLSLKNLVGLTNEKRWLPHHRIGTVVQGGDMMPDSASVVDKSSGYLSDLFSSHKYGKYGYQYLVPIMKIVYKYLVRWWLHRIERGEHFEWAQGDWYGNDTVWRMVLDLNQILLYSDKKGTLYDTPQRKYFTCVDGIIAGEKEGPLHALPKEVGLIVGGFNPVAVDLACIKLMGFNFKKISLMMGVDKMKRPLISDKSIIDFWEKIEVLSNQAEYEHLKDPVKRYFKFEPSAGWKGHIEID